MTDSLSFDTCSVCVCVCDESACEVTQPDYSWKLHEQLEFARCGPSPQQHCPPAGEAEEECTSLQQHPPGRCHPQAQPDSNPLRKAV